MIESLGVSYFSRRLKECRSRKVDEYLRHFLNISGIGSILVVNVFLMAGLGMATHSPNKQISIKIIVMYFTIISVIQFV